MHYLNLKKKETRAEAKRKEKIEKKRTNTRYANGKKRDTERARAGQKCRETEKKKKLERGMG